MILLSRMCKIYTRKHVRARVSNWNLKISGRSRYAAALPALCVQPKLDRNFRQFKDER